jgi:hypothetical protein
MPIGGLLPLSLFKGRQVDIDLPNRRLHLRPSGSPLPPDAHRVESGQRDQDASPRPFLKLGGESIPVLLDTGTYGFELPAMFLNTQQVQLQNPKSSMVGRGRIYPAERGILSEIQLGPLAIRGSQVTAIHYEQRKPIVSDSGEPPRPQAVIGMSVLKHWRLIYDAQALAISGPAVLEGAAPDPREAELEESLCREWLLVRGPSLDAARQPAP